VENVYLDFGLNYLRGFGEYDSDVSVVQPDNEQTEFNVVLGLEFFFFKPDEVTSNSYPDLPEGRAVFLVCSL